MKTTRFAQESAERAQAKDEQSQHTPKPWRLVQYSTGAEICGTDRNFERVIAHVASNRHDDPQGNANAKAIAQVPAMIEALEYYSRGPWDDGAFAKAVLKTI